MAYEVNHKVPKIFVSKERIGKFHSVGYKDSTEKRGNERLKDL